MVASQALQGIGAESVIAKTIRVQPDGLAIDGIACEKWQIEDIEPPADATNGSSLKDLRLGNRVLRAYRIGCGDKYVTTVIQPDRRVLAVSWQNDSMWLVLEKQLYAGQENAIREALLQRGFMVASDPTPDVAIRSFYESLLSEKEKATGIPERPAWTIALLERMGVVDDEREVRATFDSFLPREPRYWTTTFSGLLCFMEPCPNKRLSDHAGVTVDVIDFFNTDGSRLVVPSNQSCVFGRLARGAAQMTTDGTVSGYFIVLRDTSLPDSPVGGCK